MKIYYAHHRWKYNTPIEEYEIGLIRKTFPGATIINPNTDIQQDRAETEIMRNCIATVKVCDATVFSSVDGVIGKGVFDEVANSKTVYYIHNDAVMLFDGTFEILLGSNTKRLYAIVKEDK